MPLAPPDQLYSQPGRILLQSEYWQNRGVPFGKHHGLVTMENQTERPPTKYPMEKVKGRPHIVCLHGTACNEEVLKNQLRPLTTKWDGVHLTFLEGSRVITNTLHPTAKLISETFNTPRWLEYLETHPCDKEAKLYGMFDDGVHALEEKLKKAEAQVGRPADVLIGFSQGGLMAALMAGRTLKRQDAPPPFRCVVLLNPPNPESLKDRAPDFFTAKLGTPAMIVKGLSDGVVNCERTWEKGVFDDGPELYKDIFESIEWSSHPDGHQPFPTEAKEADKLADEIKAFVKKYTK